MHVQTSAAVRVTKASPEKKNADFDTSKHQRISLSSQRALCGTVHEMEPYIVYLAALGLLNAALAYHQYHAQKQDPAEESLALPGDDSKAAATKFKWDYFSLYALAMAADWLQVSQRSVHGRMNVD